MTVNNFSKRISYLYELIVNKVTKTVSFEKKNHYSKNLIFLPHKIPIKTERILIKSVRQSEHTLGYNK